MNCKIDRNDSHRNSHPKPTDAMKRTTLIPANSRRPAFTLIEIMVVLAVISIIATMAVPAMNGVLKGSKMTQSSDEFERDLARAQAAALRENQPVEFRFYEFRDPEQPNSEMAYRGYQAVIRKRSADDQYTTESIEPIFDVKILPPGIIFNAKTKYSSIFKVPDIPGNTAKKWSGYDDSIPRVDQAEYKAFYFRPDGSTNLVTIDSAEKWCVTIQKENTDEGELPPDFVAFQVDPFNGQIRRYEKGL